MLFIDVKMDFLVSEDCHDKAMDKIACFVRTYLNIYFCYWK
jgi:hypothetical protein